MLGFLQRYEREEGKGKTIRRKNRKKENDSTKDKKEN